jgi:succinylarginine dihydrolase
LARTHRQYVAYRGGVTTSADAADGFPHFEFENLNIKITTTIGANAAA